mmetsp:Transcript_21110/g.26714  ORF Transcript_21110/g.26714 Transcript_21110/m.26714 type:complete len:84 (-) Transcript_21110:128-379(-)
MLGNNKLTGTIPSELGKLVQISFLYLNSNCLGGEIPQELENLVEANINLSHNYFFSYTGLIPDAWNISHAFRKKPCYAKSARK